MAKRQRNIEAEPSENFLLAIRDDIRTQFKGDSRAVVDTLENLNDYLTPKRYVSTGDDILDIIISNKANGGLPLSKFINIYGDSSAGKSLICAKIVSKIQEMNGTAIYFDTEHASYPEYLKVLGVDFDKVLYVLHVRSVEKIFKTIINIILKRIKLNDKSPLAIVVDSMTATNIDAIMDDLENFDDSGFQGGAKKQKILGESIQKIIDYVKDENVIFITTDQTRDNMERANAYSPKKRSTSGNAQIFYADVRIELKKTKAIKDKNTKEEIGSEVQVNVVKNRTAPPFRKSIMYVYHTRGIDRFASYVENGKLHGIITSRGAYVSIQDENGEDIKIDGKLPTAKDVKRLLRTNEEFRKAVYDRFVKKLHIKYELVEDSAFEDLEDNVEFDDDLIEG
jgi:recombination protein RecA